MRDEIHQAAVWWQSKLKGVSTSAGKIQMFSKALEELLISKYEGHWYTDNAKKGSGFRSVAFDHSLDNILREACMVAGLTNPEKLLEGARFNIMFVNPGEVKVQNAALLSGPPDVIWSADIAR